jgi:hypothetical protein
MSQVYPWDRGTITPSSWDAKQRGSWRLIQIFMQKNVNPERMFPTASPGFFKLIVGRYFFTSVYYFQAAHLGVGCSRWITVRVNIRPKFKKSLIILLPVFKVANLKD